MSKELDTVCLNKKELTLKESIESLKCLFKAYQKDSEFNYQLNVSDSPFNQLVKLVDILSQYGNLSIEEINKRLEDDLRVFTNILKYGEKTIDDIEKELQALEILKEELWFSFSKGFRVYVQDEMKLDEEKYDLLKEVFGDEK